VTPARPGYLLLEDGRRFDGVLCGAPPETWERAGSRAGHAETRAIPGGLPEDPGRTAEVVFQTGMSGYQEVMTDPSYRSQIVVFTAPHIGNTGVNAADAEARVPFFAGAVVRSLSERPSNRRSEWSLPAWLRRHRIPCLSEVDTRAVTRHLREAGALRGILAPAVLPEAEALARARRFAGLAGRDLVREVAPPESEVRCPETSSDDPLDAVFPAAAPSSRSPRITLVDCGAKEGIAACLRRRGARVRRVVPTISAEWLLRDAPDAVWLSNGPGDPDTQPRLIETLRAILGRVPLFGICLGFQILALALGGRTRKMKHGHHGINHPVLELASGRVLVTSQNHGFEVVADSLRSVRLGGGTYRVRPTYRSLNDGTFEGFEIPELDVAAVQFHPEARGGPHDGRRLFDRAPGFGGDLHAS